MWSHSILLLALSSPGTNSSQLPDSTCNEFVEDPFFSFRISDSEQQQWLKPSLIFWMSVSAMLMVSWRSGILEDIDLFLLQGILSIFLSIYVPTSLEEDEEELLSCVGSSGKKSDSASLEKVRLSQEKVSLMLVVVLHTHSPYLSTLYRVLLCFVRMQKEM